MKDTLLVTGGSGLVGSNVMWVARGQFDVIGTYNSRPFSLDGCRAERLDIFDRAQCISLARRYEPDCVVHCAVGPSWGFEACERDTDGQSRAGIVGGTVNMAEACHEVGAKLVLISTDWVFDGHRPRGTSYSEEDTPRPICKYGAFKLEAEESIAKNLDDYLILRVAHVYGHNYAKCGSGRLWTEENLRWNSAAIKLAALLRDGEAVRQPSDVCQNATVATEFGKAVVDLWQKDCKGTYHASGKDPVSRYEFFRAMAECFGVNPDLVQEGTVEEFLRSRGAGESTIYNLAKRFPRNTAVDTTKVQTALGRPIPGFRDGLASLFKQVESMF